MADRSYYGLTGRRIPRWLAATTAAAIAVIGLPAAGLSTASAAATWTSPYIAQTADPDLDAKCGLDIEVVLDGSGSVGSSATDIKNATDALLSPLKDTNTNAGIVAFSTAMVAPDLAMTPITTANYTSTFTNAINQYTSTNYTNWDIALRTAQARLASGDRAGHPNLMVVITDGAPNHIGGTTGSTSTSGVLPTGNNAYADASTTAVNPAVQSGSTGQYGANAIRSSGTHILTVGVGAALTATGTTLQHNLEALGAISGYDAWQSSTVIPASLTSPTGPFNVQPSFDIKTTDLVLTKSYTDLGTALAKVANSLCQGSMTITKKVIVPGSSTPTVAKDWTFGAAPAADPSTYSWNTPKSATTQTTGTDGVATFKWDISDQTAWNSKSNVTVTETKSQSQSLFTMTSVQCATNDGKAVDVTFKDGVFTYPVGSTDIVTCTVINTQANQHVTPAAPSATTPTCSVAGALTITPTTGVVYSQSVKSTDAKSTTYHVTAAPAVGYTLDGTTSWDVVVYKVGYDANGNALDCRQVVTPVWTTPTDPTCLSGTTIAVPSSPHVTYTKTTVNGQFVITATPDAGYKFDPDVPSIQKKYDILPALKCVVPVAPGVTKAECLVPLNGQWGSGDVNITPSNQHVVYTITGTGSTNHPTSTLADGDNALPAGTYVVVATPASGYVWDPSYKGLTSFPVTITHPADCRGTVVPVAPTVTAPTCDSPTVVTPATTPAHVNYAVIPGNGSVTVRATPATGYKFDPDTAYVDFTITIDKKLACVAPVAPTTTSAKCDVPPPGHYGLGALNITLTEGVDYYLGSTKLNVGANPEPAGDYVVTAVLQAGYHWLDGSTANKTLDTVTVGHPDPLTCTVTVTPETPDITQSETCNVQGSYTIPDQVGVHYLLDGEPIDPGTYAGPITGSEIVAEPDQGYVFPTMARTTWKLDVPAALICATPEKPAVSQSEICNVQGTFDIPNTVGVQYYLNDEPIAAGTHNGPVNGTITASAKDGYEIKDSEWFANVDLTAADVCPIVHVVKVADGGGQTQFGFTATDPSLDGHINFSLANGGKKDITYNLATDTTAVVSVSENNTAGWTLKNVICASTIRESSAISTLDPSELSLSAGADITCTFTNVPITSGVTIVKSANRGPGFVSEGDFFDSVAGVRGLVTTFRYDVTNTGNTPLTGVVLGDDLNFGPTLGSSVVPSLNSSLLSCYVGTSGSPSTGKGAAFTLGSPISGLQIAAGTTSYLFCDLLIPSTLADNLLETNRIFDIANVTGTPTGATPVSAKSNQVLVKVFPAKLDAYPLKNIVDTDGSHARAFDNLGIITTPTPKTFRMTIDNVSDKTLNFVLYDYFTNDSIGLTAAQRNAIMDGMRCINYDNPAAYGPGFPNPIAGSALPEIYSTPVDTTFGNTNAGITAGTGAGTFYAKSYNLGPIAPGDGFEIACQTILPVGEYTLTNVFRMVANDAPVQIKQLSLATGGAHSAAAAVRPTAAAPTGTLDVTAQAGLKAGTPVDAVPVPPVVVTPVVVAPIPNPSVTKTVDVGNNTAVNNGDVLTYTVKLANSGTGPAVGNVVDTLPAGVDPVAGSFTKDAAAFAPNSITATTITWNGVTVAAGKTVTLTYQVTVLDTATADLVNKVTWLGKSSETTNPITPGVQPRTGSPFNPITGLVWVGLLLAIGGLLMVLGRRKDENEA